jgi:hypothetical protein
MLVQFYFPEEAQQVRNLVSNSKQPMTEAAASLHVLGLSFENLAIGIAKSWGLPENIQRCMRFPAGSPPSSASPDAAERIRWVATASNDIADVMLKYDPKEAAQHVAHITRKYAKAVGNSESHLNGT